MTPKPILAAFAVATLALAACQPAPPTNEASSEDVLPALAPGETRTEATITLVEDAGYPMFHLAATVPGRPAPLDLLLNAQGADLRGVEPASFKGKAVTLTYATAEENALMDLRVGGRSLLGGDAPKNDPAWRTAAGVLSGAEAPTAGDLPDEIAVTDAAGAKTTFEYFVTPTIVAANGKQVTAHYAASSVNRVTALRLASE